jgi:pilus assembly protein CpaB
VTAIDDCGSVVTADDSSGEYHRMARPRGLRIAPARLLVLGLSIVAGGIAAYLAAGSGEKKVVAQVVQLPTNEVLVAKSDIGLGQTLTAENVEWQPWPTTATGANFIRRSDRPDAAAGLAGAIARFPFIAGEPIRDAKIVTLHGTGFMAAILPTGMRAVSTPISPETGAGGFILPNDRVDVILSKRDKGNDVVRSQIVINNVRVLAIDQLPKEKDGANALIGRTATLEATPEQAENLARANLSGSISLALRSIADAEGSDKSARKMVAIYRGVDSQTNYSCKPACNLQ